MWKKFQRNSQGENKEPADTRMIGMLILLVVVTMVVFAVYRFLLDFYYFELVLIAYMAIATVFLLIYLIYNRGFSRRGVTEEMLPADWSEEKKQAFLADGPRRLSRSRWMLIPIFAFLFTLTMDLIELVVVPLVADLFLK